MKLNRTASANPASSLHRCGSKNHARTIFRKSGSRKPAILVWDSFSVPVLVPACPLSPVPRTLTPRQQHPSTPWLSAGSVNRGPWQETSMCSYLCLDVLPTEVHGSAEGNKLHDLCCVPGRRMTPPAHKDVHLLPSRTRDYVTIQGKKESKPANEITEVAKQLTLKYGEEVRVTSCKKDLPHCCWL